MSPLKVWTKCFNSVQWENERLLEKFKIAWHLYDREQSQELPINKEKNSALCVKSLYL